MSSLRKEFPHLRDELDQEDWAGLLYLETGTFMRYAQACIDAVDRERLAECFEFARRAYLDGDDDVENALGVAFMEDLNFRDGKVSRSWAVELIPPGGLPHAFEVLNRSP
ncbi:MAG TPA: hypothetical protein VGW38_22735 [Chloroflexota bacterium]|nr:hypothetical protein [Chloroflexota bacterium]